MVERAIFPFSSHHFCRSELAGETRLDGIISDQLLSSSESSTLMGAIPSPTSALRRS